MAGGKQAGLINFTSCCLVNLSAEKKKYIYIQSYAGDLAIQTFSGAGGTNDLLQHCSPHGQALLSLPELLKLFKLSVDFLQMQLGHPARELFLCRAVNAIEGHVVHGQLVLRKDFSGMQETPRLAHCTTHATPPCSFLRASQEPSTPGHPIFL